LGLVLLALGVLKVALQIIVIGVDFKSLLIGSDGLIHSVKILKSVSFSLEASGPVWFDLDALFSVFQSLFVFSGVDVTGGSIGEIGVIIWVTFDGFAEMFDGFVETFVLESVIA